MNISKRRISDRTPISSASTTVPNATLCFDWDATSRSEKEKLAKLNRARICITLQQPQKVQSEYIPIDYSSSSHMGFANFLANRKEIKRRGTLHARTEELTKNGRRTKKPLKLAFQMREKRRALVSLCQLNFLQGNIPKAKQFIAQW